MPNKYDARCGVCGEAMRAITGDPMVCKECVRRGVDKLEFVQARGVHHLKVPLFVIEYEIFPYYRTFLVCQNCEPMKHWEAVDHASECSSCGEYVRSCFS